MTTWWIRPAGAVVRAWTRSLRLTARTAEGRPVAPGDDWLRGRLFAVCERDLPALLPLAARVSWVTMVASSRDGDWAAALARQLGGRIARGSSRGGGLTALGELRRLLTDDAMMVISVDGPLGPAGVAKPGIAAIAAMCGRDIHPVGVAARGALRLPRTWSGIYVPWPGARVACVFGPPIPAPATIDRRTRAAIGAAVTQGLADARIRALAEVET